MVVCRNCASQLPDGALSCPSCGTRIAPYRAEEAKQYIANLQPEAPIAASGPSSSVANVSHIGHASICTNCGYQGDSVTRTKGSFWVEVVLWVCLILPGLIYSVWRLATRIKVCPNCRQATMIPLDTPRGQELAWDYAASSQSIPPQESIQ